MMPAAKALIERMPRREVHAPDIVDHGALQRFGQLDEIRHARRRARHAIADDDGVLASTSIFAASAMAPASPCGGTTGASLGICRLSPSGIGFSCSSASSDEKYRPHRRRRRDLVGAHRRLGEMLERSRLIVPFGEVAHERADVDAECTQSAPGMRLSASMMLPPITRPAHGRTKRCRSPSSRAAGRRCRGRPSPSACLRSWRSPAHVNGDVLVHAGDDFRLLLPVIEDGFVQAAKTRRAVDRQISMPSELTTSAMKSPPLVV